MRWLQGWPGVHVPQLHGGQLHRAGAKCKTDLHFTSPCGSLSAPISLIAIVGLQNRTETVNSGSTGPAEGYIHGGPRREEFNKWGGLAETTGHTALLPSLLLDTAAPAPREASPTLPHPTCLPSLPCPDCWGHPSTWRPSRLLPAPPGEAVRRPRLPRWQGSGPVVPAPWPELLFRVPDLNLPPY